MKTIQIKILKADEGKILTNGESYSTQVMLSEADKAENWREIPMSEVPENDLFSALHL